MKKKGSCFLGLFLFILNTTLGQNFLTNRQLYARALVFQIDKNYDSAYVFLKKSKILTSSVFINSEDLFNCLQVYSETSHEKEAINSLKELKVTPEQYNAMFTRKFKNIKKYEKLNNIIKKQIQFPDSLVINKLNNLYNLDQISRFSYIKKEISASDLSKIDSVNFKMFIDLYNQFGFPSELIVGRKNFKKVLLLLHHFSYEKKFFDTLEPILLDEYFNNVISHQVISYVFDMYYERCEKSYYFCNTILFKDKRKELKPDFFNNSCTYDSINMNRFMYGLIPLRYHLKAVKRVNKKNVILSIINLIFNPPHYIYNGHWVYNYSYKIDYEITKSKNTILNYKCL